jgi:hypothetical protein
MTPDGPVTEPDIALAANSVTTVLPTEQYELQTDFSTKVECLEGESIAVDRTMTWLGQGASFAEGHSSVGLTAPDTTWYLPEGSSAWGFETWLLIQNPNAGDAHCQVTYMLDGGVPVTVEKTVPANTRRSYPMADDIGEADASIMVTSDIPVAPERSMYRYSRREGHDSVGTNLPSNDYYLSEGSTAWGFTTYVLVQNPNADVTDVTLTYMTPSGEVAGPSFTMQPNSRETVRVNDALQNSDFSTHVRGSLPIIAERAMYWGEGTPAGEACHDSIGLAAPHTTFYLPGGQTGYGFERWFETYTCVQNPNDTDVEVRVTYLTPEAAHNAEFTSTIGANSRATFNMADRLTDTRAAVLVECLTPGMKVMAERATYWDGKTGGVETIGGFSE